VTSESDRGPDIGPSQADLDAEDLRDRQIWRAIIIGGVLTALVVCGFGWRFVAPRLDAAKRLDQAVVLVNRADPALLALDSALTAAASQPSTAAVAALRDLAPRLAQARADLTGAEALTGADISRLTDEEQRQAHLVEAGAQARLGELDALPGIAAAAQTAADQPSPAHASALKALVADAAGMYQAAKRQAAEADAALKAR
jgi:hypothetical protein